MVTNLLLNIVKYTHFKLLTQILSNMGTGIMLSWHPQIKKGFSVAGNKLLIPIVWLKWLLNDYLILV